MSVQLCFAAFLLPCPACPACDPPCYSHPPARLPTRPPVLPQPTLVESPALEGETVSKVAAGARHTLALCSSGKAFAWGWGAFGQLGSGAYASSALPVPVAVPEGAKVTDLSAGWWHSLFLTA